MSFILLAEDDDMVREMLKMVLENENFRVRGVKSCDEAAGILLRHRPSLIVMDYWLGTELADDLFKIAKEDFNDPIPIVLCSGWHGIHEIAKKNGIDHVVTKPFSIEEMVIAVANAMPVTSVFSSNTNVEAFFNSLQSIRSRQSP
jgi:DNA-binding response OmpR family regulator